MPLNNRLSVINNKKLFAFRQQDEALFRKMLKLLIQTNIGRRLLDDISSLLKQKQEHIFFAMRSPSVDSDGETYPDLHVLINHVDTSYMSQKQKDKSLFTQTITLTHELTHVRQFLSGSEDQMAAFSAPHQLYAYLLQEAEASLSERLYEQEMAKLYPSLAAGMRLQRDVPNWRENYLRTFFLQEDEHFPITNWIDTFVEGLWNMSTFVLSGKKEDRMFRQWAETSLKGMGVNITYDDVALEKMWPVTPVKGGKYLWLQSDDTELKFDREGRVAWVSKGFVGENESDIQYLFFMKNYDRKKYRAMVRRVKELYPQASARCSKIEEIEFGSEPLAPFNPVQLHVRQMRGKGSK